MGDALVFMRKKQVLDHKKDVTLTRKKGLHKPGAKKYVVKW